MIDHYSVCRYTLNAKYKIKKAFHHKNQHHHHNYLKIKIVSDHIILNNFKWRNSSNFTWKSIMSFAVRFRHFDAKFLRTARKKVWIDMVRLTFRNKTKLNQCGLNWFGCFDFLQDFNWVIHTHIEDNIILYLVIHTLPSNKFIIVKISL